MKILSWADRLALIDHYAPTDDAICRAFNLTPNELSTARNLRSQGTFVANPNFDVGRYSTLFDQTSAPAVPLVARTAKIGGATMHTRPESATKQPHVPQKRGRKGTKIIDALRAVPTVAVPVLQFSQEHGVSVAVLRQAKRFIEGAPDAAQIGTIVVKQDKASKELMIWRTQPEGEQP